MCSVDELDDTLGKVNVNSEGLLPLHGSSGSIVANTLVKRCKFCLFYNEAVLKSIDSVRIYPNSCYVYSLLLRFIEASLNSFSACQPLVRLIYPLKLLSVDVA